MQWSSYRWLTKLRGGGGWRSRSRRRSRKARHAPNLNYDPLDQIERDLVAAAVVKLGGLRAGVVGNLLGLFQGAAVRPECRDAGGAERMAADAFGKPCGLGPALNHLPGVVAVHGAGG